MEADCSAVWLQPNYGEAMGNGMITLYVSSLLLLLLICGIAAGLEALLQRANR